MGLDMYLIKRKKRLKKDNENLWKFSNYLIYWRKANQIHRYFCEYGEEIEAEVSYRISKEVLEQLLNLCDKVLEKVQLVDGKVCVGMHYNQDIELWEQDLADGKIVANIEEIEDILPTQKGFFFGSTDYDEFYISQIRTTRDQLEITLNNINFENEEVFYLASW